MTEIWNVFKRLKFSRPKRPEVDLSQVFQAKYERFKELLESNSEVSKIIADLEVKLRGQQVFGMSYVRSQSARAVFHTLRMIQSLNALSNQKYPTLPEVLDAINQQIKDDLGQKREAPVTDWVLPYSRVTTEVANWVGNKSANLGEMLNHVKVPIPEGFAITTHAFELFLLSNDLIDEINKAKMEIDPNDPQSISLVSEDIQALIVSAEVPSELADVLLSAYDSVMDNVHADAPSGTPREVSLRSSAIGEDSELSFAGQYLSILNVPRAEIIQSYKRIVASLYTPRAISYRLAKGIRDEDIAMSVACLQMVDSVSSGIAYSRHPFKVDDDGIIITAVWGMGPYAVDGIVTPDRYIVSRDTSPVIRREEISNKPVKLMRTPGGGLREEPVPESQRDAPCLSREQILLLAGYVQKLENHYGYPQDIEWAIDSGGRMFILQTRPLRTDFPDEKHTQTVAVDTVAYPLLVEGGEPAYPGTATGPAFHVTSDRDLLDFPEGAVLIAKHSSPKYVMVMRKAAAIVTDTGSVTGHMASLSREFGVPTVLDAKTATASIPRGAEITVDAHCGRVYLGKVPQFHETLSCRLPYMIGTPVHGVLKKVAESIVPLRLFDPKSPSFTPRHCRSLHDIQRLVHEFSYSEMFQLSDFVTDDGGFAVKLNAPIPLDLYLIDLGGGLTESRGHRRKVTVDAVTSIPFKAVLKGMLHEDLRYHRPRPVELRGFLSVMSEQMLAPPRGGAERFGDPSYAIISDKYVNFSSRVGYHYSVLDSYCGQTIGKNYISFSFKGGAADDVRRSRRARAIAKILTSLDFNVETMADRVDARLQKYERQVIEEKLDMIGRLLQFTRQLDMLMCTESSIDLISDSFLQGNYHLENLSRPPPPPPYDGAGNRGGCARHEAPKPPQRSYSSFRTM